jgi:hydroxymethylglutaryl-CoA reductase
MHTKKSSNLSKFYKRNIQERQEIVQDWVGLDPNQIQYLNDSGLTIDGANNMIENVIGRYSLPFAIATNFKVNQKDYLIPMVIEEPSVVAACSFAGKLFRENGGFKAYSDHPIMIGQIQIVDVDDIDDTEKVLYSHRDEILRRANEVGGSIIKRGGGAVDIEVRSFADTAIGHMVVLHLLYDTRDAMGANAVNTAVEYLAPYIEEITSGRVNLRILSNLTDRRKAYAEGTVLKDSLATDTLSGEDVVDAIIEAGVFAEIDPYRATTHNKGIMNGIDAVLMATGNDWRAVESGAHAFAARSGSYTSLTQWTKDENGDLPGKIELPLAVGIVGGATRVHPNAQIALQILGVSTASELAEVIATVGLAQNFAAIRALATDGIQHGHMRMHARQLAVAAGADVDMVSVITQRMINEKNIRLERAKQLVAEYREGTE